MDIVGHTVRTGGRSRRMSTISPCGSDSSTGFAPSASLPSTAAGCMVAPACSPIPTCTVLTASRTDAWSSATIPEFLNAFLKGEVTRLVVVERLENPPGSKVASGWLPDAVGSLFNPSDRVGQYVAADGH